MHVHAARRISVTLTVGEEDPTDTEGRARGADLSQANNIDLS